MDDFLKTRSPRVQRLLSLLRHRRHFFSFLLFGLVLIVCATAFARVGGGQKYVGSGGGFSGGGDGGGGAALAYFIIRLAIVYPEVGIPAGIIIVAFYVIRRRRNPTNTTRRAVNLLEKDRNRITGHDQGLSRLKSMDPDFDAELFLERTRKAAVELQDAWLARELEPVRRFMSDAVYNRFSVQLSLLGHRNLKNVMSDHAYTGFSILAVDSGSDYDTIHVKITGRARDIEVPAYMDEEKASAKASKAPLETYHEVWSLMRRKGAKTKPGINPVEGNCPNCGAPLELAHVTKCDHCGALVDSGEHDWVLAEITQYSEWQPSSGSSDVAGLRGLQKKDPGLSRQELEDRASYMFWKWIEARVLGKPKLLARVASREFVSRLDAEIKDLAGSGSGTMLYRPAVGAVDLTECTEDSEDGMDRAYVRIIWSAAFRENARSANTSHILCLARHADAKGNHGLSWARCSECSAPLDETDSLKCSYCDADLTPDRGSWVLESLDLPEAVPVKSSREQYDLSMPSGGMPAFMPDMGDRRERVLLLTRMAAVAVADGVVTKEERHLVKTFAKRWQVPVESVDPILSGEVPVEQAMTILPADRRGFFTLLIQAALVDGRIDRKERKLLYKVAGDLEMQQSDADELIAQMMSSR